MGAMYLWAIALLTLLAVVSGYTLHLFPWALISAVASAVVADILISRFHHKHKLRIPFSAIITGLIVGSVAPHNAPVALAVLASLVAILAKNFVRVRRVNVFNPAALGLIVALALFSMGDEWWAAGSFNVYGVAISLAPILIVSAYQARRLTASLSFAIASVGIAIAANLGYLSSLGGVAALLFSANYYMAFIMVAEPKTSPHKRLPQAVFGAGVAVGIAVFAMAGAPYPSLLALLIGNIAYTGYRIRPQKSVHQHVVEEAVARPAAAAQ